MSDSDRMIKIDQAYVTSWARPKIICTRCARRSRKQGYTSCRDPQTAFSVNMPLVVLSTLALGMLVRDSADFSSANSGAKYQRNYDVSAKSALRAAVRIIICNKPVQLIKMRLIGGGWVDTFLTRVVSHLTFDCHYESSIRFSNGR